MNDSNLVVLKSRFDACLVGKTEPWKLLRYVTHNEQGRSIGYHNPDIYYRCLTLSQACLLLRTDVNRGRSRVVKVLVLVVCVV
jgi:hypothetical protein